MNNLLKFSLFLIITASLSCSLSNNKKAAVFKSGFISFKEIKTEYIKLGENDKSKLSSNDDYYKFVRKIALEHIILNKAYEKKIASDDAVKKRIGDSDSSIALKILFDKNINEKIKVESKDFDKYSKLYELYQIVKRHDILDDKKIKDSKDMLERISKEIGSLAEFKEYASRLSDDISSQNGGYVGKIRLGIMEDGIDEVIKKLPVNTVSKVVESSAGFHIFFIPKIENADINELYKDRDLYEIIYNEKKEQLEEIWYNKLLKDPSLSIDEKKILSDDNSDEAVIKFKNRKITKKEFNDTVNGYKKYSFPDPSKDDLLRLADNLGLQMILDHMAAQSVIKNSKEFKKTNEYNKKLILIDEYIKKNIAVKPISEDDIKIFYEKNKNTLFTFKDYKGGNFIQPMNEVIKFIEQNLQDENIKQARYDLYKKLVDEEQLKIDESVIKELKTYIYK